MYAVTLCVSYVYFALKIDSGLMLRNSRSRWRKNNEVEFNELGKQSKTINEILILLMYVRFHI